MADVTGQIADNPNDRVSTATKTPAAGPRVIIGAPDYRVFVWGVEVTQDVLGVQISLQVDDSISTATVTLTNDNEKWIVPNALNLMRYDSIPDELSLPADGGLLYAGANQGTNTIGDGIVTPADYVPPTAFAKKKRENFQKALSGNKQLSTGRDAPSSALLALQSRFQNSPNFPFIPGRPMLQMGDPIRVFLKNPWAIAANSSVVGPQLPGVVPGTAEEWYFGFTGYVAVATEQFDAKTNRSNIILLCEDIRRLLRYMRTTTSPDVFNINTIDTSVSVGSGDNYLKRVAGDAILISGSQAFQAGMKLVNTDPEGAGPPGIVDLLLFGDTGNLENLGFIVQRPDNAAAGMQLIAGVLGFNPNSKTISLLSGSAGGGELERAISTTLDQIYPRLNESDVARYGADWSLGADPTVAPEPNHFYVILPDKAGFGPSGTGEAANFFWPYDFAMRIDYYVEFRSRLDVINEYVKTIESMWYATPKGDMVLQFPFYDGIPQQFSSPWRNIMQLRDEFTGFSSSEDDRNIKTLTIAQGSPIEGLESKGSPPINVGRKFNAELAARYGIREQRDERPFKYAEDYASSSLRTLAALWQELANADAYRIEGLTMTPNFRAALGVPYHFQARNQIGLATGVHHQVAWGAVAQTTYDLHYVRHFDIVTGTWEKIGGGFGWHWINNPGQGGEDSVTGSTGPVHQDVSDLPAEGQEQANQVDGMLADITGREAATGQQILTQPERTRLEQISGALRQERDPAFRTRLVSEASSIVSKVRL